MIKINIALPSPMNFDGSFFILRPDISQLGRVTLDVIRGITQFLAHYIAIAIDI